MKHWKSLTKIDLTKGLPFSSTFLEVHFLLGTNQSQPLSVEQIVSEFSEQPGNYRWGWWKWRWRIQWTNYTSLKKWRWWDNQNFEQIS